MQRRQFNQASVSAIGALVFATYQQAQALSLGNLAGISNQDASTGLKTALEKGALAAVALIGARDECSINTDGWRRKFDFYCRHSIHWQSMGC